MKYSNRFLIIVSILSLFVFSFCKKEETIPYAHLVGNWTGIETYEYFLNDSLETTIRYNLNLFFYADGTGVSIDNRNGIDSLVWSYNDKRKEIDIRVKSLLPPALLYKTYPFSIIENKERYQKWSYFETYPSVGKVRKNMNTWEINKK